MPRPQEAIKLSELDLGKLIQGHGGPEAEVRAERTYVDGETLEAVTVAAPGPTEEAVPFVLDAIEARRPHEYTVDPGAITVTHGAQDQPVEDPLVTLVNELDQIQEHLNKWTEWLLEHQPGSEVVSLQLMAIQSQVNAVSYLLHSATVPQEQRNGA